MDTSGAKTSIDLVIARWTVRFTAGILLAASLACVLNPLWPRTIPLGAAARTPAWALAGDRGEVSLADRFVVARVGGFDDELMAYLMFDYWRSRHELRGIEVLLGFRETNNGFPYSVYLRGSNDVLAAVPSFAGLEASGLIPGFEWRFLNDAGLRRLRQQTMVFRAAYSLPTRARLESLPGASTWDYTRRFILFKSLTDPRSRISAGPRVPVLSAGEASRLAADILDVAEFFSLPLDSFLGIAAMENNYMNIPGDLSHAVWKRRAQPGDIVLRRLRRRVLVLDPAAGVWQITRETLRFAHALYLKDQRDYSLLPERLRPPLKLDPDALDADVLTTYAGILLRHLLDRFDGDVARAVAAYNGGPGRPNMRYEAGVRMVASYARKFVEQAAVLGGRPAAGMKFFAPDPR